MNRKAIDFMNLVPQQSRYFFDFFSVLQRGYTAGDGAEDIPIDGSLKSDLQKDRLVQGDQPNRLLSFSGIFRSHAII
jgi:hypothetical protein